MTLELSVNIIFQYPSLSLQNEQRQRQHKGTFLARDSEASICLQESGLRC